MFSLAPATETPSDRYVIYTANINATLQNCGCGKIPLGGIDRIKTLVDSFRAVHPGVILLDGGDFLNSYPFPELNKATLNALDRLMYTFLVPGEHEFVAGFEMVKQHFEGNLLLSNIRWNENPGTISEYLTGNLRFRAVIDVGCFERIDLPGGRINPDLINIISDQRSDSVYDIVVYHGSLNHIFEGSFDVQGAGMILLAHDQYSGVQYVSGVPVVGAGKDGEQIVIITISERFETEIRHIKITERIKPDPAVVRISRQLDQEMGRN